MYLIVGLGNPEKDYSNTRHNMGFDVINRISEKYDIDVNKSKFKGLYGSGVINGEKIILLKPQTFMNLSGESVKEIMDYYKISLENLLVVYDDMDLEPGTIRIRKSGGPGTHNGMKSVVHYLNSQNFPRIRVGIGKPIDDSFMEYVIGAVDEEERKILVKGVEKAFEAITAILENNIDFAMNKFN
ncbi:MAG: aminoacyl-tRNA hydrolase [Clostridia bacterium]|nr:aminoacyl-tRNA hydrolase [Clostridia bacterium]